MPEDGAGQLDDQSEASMRRALERIGAKKPREGRTPSPSFSNAPMSGRNTVDGQKRRFVRDGEVPVMLVTGSRPPEGQSQRRGAGPVSDQIEAANMALRSERAAHEAADRALREANATIQDLRTKLGHIALARDEATEAARRAEAARALLATALASGFRAAFLGAAGLVALAARDNEIRVEYLGSSVQDLIAANFVIAAFLGGVGGAFGAREDISLQVHTCLLALRTSRPVRMAYSRHESFLGHVHRHPCRITMRHHADHDGRLLRVEATFVFDGGAYASTSSAVLINGITHAQGPYHCENATVDGWAVRTNNLPCGAMRGFGVVQACFAHEAQMDKLAAAVGVEPLEIRLRNAMRTGDRLITGQVVESVAPVERLIRELAELPLRTSRGATVPLGAVATVELGTGRNSVLHDGARRLS